MTFPYRGRGAKAGVRQGELWTDAILMGGSVSTQTDQGFIQASGANLVISGTNLFLDGTGTSDIIIGGTYSGTNAYLDKNLYVGGSIRGETSYYPQASIGSPAAQVAALIQGGSGATGAGSVIWLVFPTGYAEVPSVVAQLSAASANEDYTLVIGTIDEGSVQVYSIGAASQEFTWMAIGKP